MASDHPAPASAGFGGVYRLLRRPGVGWGILKVHPPSLRKLLAFAALGAAIGPICRAIVLATAGQSLNGVNYRPGIGPIVLEALLSYGLILGLTAAFVCLLMVWARLFVRTATWRASSTLAVYASLPGWIGGVFYLVPASSGLTAVASLYGVYLFSRGANILLGLRGRAVFAYVGLVLASYIGLSVALAAGLRRMIAAL